VIVERITNGLSRRDNWPTLTPTEYLDMMNQFTFNGVQYTLPGDKEEDIDSGMFREVVRSAYKQNGIVFACMLVRMMVFSEARLQWRERNGGRPGALFGDRNLAMFEKPWRGATTADLMKRMIQYADLGGNAYIVRRPWQDGTPGCRVLRPDWTSLIIGSMEDADILAWDVDAEVIGYKYQPGGAGSRRPAQYFLADEVAHFAPIPDPEAQFRGMSWITPVVREIMADKAASNHKLKFFENGATPNLVVKLNVDDLTKFQAWVKGFREQYEGQMNAYKTMFLGAGADPTVVGSNLRQLDFKVVQGAGETRIAAAAGTPPVIVGLSEGLDAATYSNYGQARRRLNDMTIRPLWRDACGSLQQIASMPDARADDGSVELWYDDRDIPALKDDQTEQAAIMFDKSKSALALFQAGYEPGSIVDALEANDFTLLSHTGLTTVQVQSGKTKDFALDEPAASTSGKGA
jgi:hypothetical protein